MRKNLSRAIVVAGGLTLVVGLTACGAATTTSAEPSASTTPSASASETTSASASPSETAAEATATASPVGEATTGPVEASTGDVQTPDPAASPVTVANEAPYFVVPYGEGAGFRQDADYSGPGDNSPDVTISVAPVEGQPAGTFSVKVENETDAAFDMTKATLRAEDSSGNVVATMTDIGTNYFPTPIPAGQQLEQWWYFAVDPTAVTIIIKPAANQYAAGWATTGNVG